MYDYSLLIYPILLFVLLFYNAKITPIDTCADSFLTLSQTKALQVFACIGVVLHHVTQHITHYGAYNKGPITIFSSMGILFTSVFFFCSGYGLYTSFITKQNYLKQFLSHRLFTVLIPFFTANTLYVIIYSMNRNLRFSTKQILRYVFGLSLINSNGWFIIEIAVLYIAFYILFKFINNKDIALGLLCILTLGLILYTKGRGHDSDSTMPNSSWFRGEWWFNSTITFILGLIIARLRTQIITFFRRFYKALIIIIPILFIIIFRIEEHILLTRGYYKITMNIDRFSNSTVTLICQSILCVIFIILIMLISYRITFSNKVLSIISTVCTELFLIHNLFVTELTNGLSMKGHARYIVAIVPSFIIAFVLSKVDKVLLKLLHSFTKSFDTWFSDLDLAPIKKLLLRLLAVTGCILIIIFGYLVCTNLRLFAGREYQEEIDLLKNSNVGSIVPYGRFNTANDFGKERLNWIVVSIEGNRYTLVSEKGISGSSYNRKHTLVTWMDSDLRALLNSNKYLSIFSKKERALLRENSCGDIVSILTVEEALAYFNSDNERILIATKIAKDEGININTLSKTNHWDFKDNKSSWWWLRCDDDSASLMAPIVSCDGTILTEEKYVNKPAGAVRPVIIVELP